MSTRDVSIKFSWFKEDYIASIQSSDPLKDAIVQQSFEHPCEIVYEQVKAKHEIRNMKREKTVKAADSLRQLLSTSLQRSMDLAQEKGSSIRHNEIRNLTAKLTI